MPQFVVSASHPVRPGFRKIMEARPEAGPAGGFYVSESFLGCGKTYATAESAIRGILADHAYSVTMLRPVEVADMPAAEDCPSVKWRMVESGHWRATANGREVWAFRSQPGQWHYGTAEGREAVASTGGAGSVTDAKRYAVALANALPADAKPLPVLNLGERGTMWPEDFSLPGRAWVVRFYRPASRPAPVPPVAPDAAPEVTSKPEAEAAADLLANYRAAFPHMPAAAAVADLLAKSPRTDAAMLAQYKPAGSDLGGWLRFAHADGSAYLVRCGTDWRGMLCGANGSRREFESAADMLAALRQYREAADFLALSPAEREADTAAKLESPDSDPMPNAADSIWSDAVPADVVAKVNGELVGRYAASMTDSELAAVHTAYNREGIRDSVLLAARVMATREPEAEATGRAAFRACTPRAGYPYGSPLNDARRIAAWLAGYDAARREYELATDSAAEADAESFVPDPADMAAAEAELSAWFAKVDSALAILGEPVTSGGEREAYPESGLTDESADNFALYLATEYRPRRALAGDYVAAFRTTDGTQFIGDDGVHADTSRDGRRYRTAAEAEEAAREACRKLRDAGEVAGMARAVRVAGGEG